MEIQRKANVGKIDAPEANLHQDLMSALQSLAEMVCEHCGDGEEVKGMVDRLGKSALGNKEESNDFLTGFTRKHNVLELKQSYNAS